MNRIWSIGLMWLLVAASGGAVVAETFCLGNRDRLASKIVPIGSQQMVGRKAIEPRVADVPEPPEVIARIQKIIDSVVEEIDRPMGVWFAAKFR